MQLDSWSVIYCDSSVLIEYCVNHVQGETDAPFLAFVSWVEMKAYNADTPLSC